MMKDECRLCGQEDVKSGKDELVYEDDFCYIVDNGNTHLKIDGILKFAKKRFSLILKKHKSKLDKKETKLVYSTFEKFMTKDLGLKLDEDYFFKCTMGTYADHYHTHAYVPPFRKKGVIV